MSSSPTPFQKDSYTFRRSTKSVFLAGHVSKIPSLFWPYKLFVFVSVTLHSRYPFTLSQPLHFPWTSISYSIVRETSHLFLCDIPSSHPKDPPQSTVEFTPQYLSCVLLWLHITRDSSFRVDEVIFAPTRKHFVHFTSPLLRLSRRSLTPLTVQYLRLVEVTCVPHPSQPKLVPTPKNSFM